MPPKEYWSRSRLDWTLEIMRFAFLLPPFAPSPHLSSTTTHPAVEGRLKALESGLAFGDDAGSSICSEWVRAFLCFHQQDLHSRLPQVRHCTSTATCLPSTEHGCLQRLWRLPQQRHTAQNLFTSHCRPLQNILTTSTCSLRALSARSRFRPYTLSSTLFGSYTFSCSRLTSK